MRRESAVKLIILILFLIYSNPKRAKKNTNGNIKIEMIMMIMRVKQ